MHFLLGMSSIAAGWGGGGWGWGGGWEVVGRWEKGIKKGRVQILKEEEEKALDGLTSQSAESNLLTLRKLTSSSTLEKSMVMEHLSWL